MKTVKDFKPGDVLLFHNSGFLPKGIQFFMNIYRRKKGLPERKLYYNHVAVIVNLWGELWMADSAKNGVQVNKIKVDALQRDNVLHLTWKEPLAKVEQKLFSKTAIGYSLRVTRYDVINFWDQARYILSGKWKGKTDDASTKRVYCSEFAAICMDKVRNSFNGQTWDKNPLDIELCEELIKFEK
ncbi:MAG: hypothetical protein ACQER7_14745 [Bacteroidota bacterium]